MNVYGGKLYLQTFKKRAVATHHDDSLDIEFKMLADWFLAIFYTKGISPFVYLFFLAPLYFLQNSN